MQSVFLSASRQTIDLLQQQAHEISLDVVLYNREELLQQLQQHGQKLSPACTDEALLLSLIDSCGFDALASVNGDFAGVIHEGNKFTLFRDHMGIRPLYYYLNREFFACASDLRALTALPAVDCAVDETQLYLRLIHGNYFSMDATDFQHIKCVKPGHSLTVVCTPQGFEKTEQPYWVLKKKKIPRKTEREYTAEFRALIEDAVRRRASVFSEPLGGELSGGLDSSLIDILVSRMGKNIMFGSWSQPENEIPLVEDDEREIIREICDREQKECFYIADEDEAFQDIYAENIPPFVNTVFIAITARKMRERGVGVVFTGHGGDEVVSYRGGLITIFANHEYLACIKELYRGTKGLRFRWFNTLKRLLKLVKLCGAERCRIIGNPDSVADVLNPAYSTRMRAECVEQPYLFGTDVITHINQGAERPRLDNIAFQGALYDVRYVVPFLDYRVVEYAVSIPRHLYRKHGVSRYIYRKAFRDVMPRSLINVDYKDTPSQRAQAGERVTPEYLQTTIRDALARLDEAVWGNYFDFQRIEQKYLQDDTDFDPTTKRAASDLSVELVRCALIQNLQNHKEGEPENA